MKYFLSFQDARSYMRSMGFRSKLDWEAWCKAGNRPANIPSLPNATYKADWVNWSDFLGYRHRMSYGEVRISQFLSANEIDYKPQVKFDDCCDKASLPFDFGIYRDGQLCALIEFQGQQHFIEVEKWGGSETLESTQRRDQIKKTYCQDKNIPLFVVPYQEIEDLAPILAGYLSELFPDKSFELEADLNDQAFGTWMSFQECRELVRGLKLAGVKEWRKWAKSDARPLNVPIFPDCVYAKHGWMGYGDFLGTGNLATFNREFVSYNECKSIARDANIDSLDSWRSFVKNSNRNDLPLYPEQTYVNQGWKGSYKFLGTEHFLLSFEECRKCVRALDFKSKTEWVNAVLNRPDNVPYSPNEYYKDKGWISWGDFLGFKIWLPFDEAKQYVQQLKLASCSAWLRWHDENKPLCIPKYPNSVYKEAWANWNDWIGK